MEVADAQREMRAVFVNGSVGQIVAGTLWLTSAALATWVGERPAVIALVLGGMSIYPLTQLVLRLAGRPSAPGRDNPLSALAMQIAFIVPLSLPLVGAASLHEPNWFYPGCMLVVGVHYMPFVFLYGMRSFAALAALLIGGAVALGFAQPESFAIGGWLTGAALVLFGAAVARRRDAAPIAAGTGPRGERA
jgi:hypothetical protein